MTVKELIQALEKLPGDTPVYCADGEPRSDEIAEIENVWFEDYDDPELRYVVIEYKSRD